LLSKEINCIELGLFYPIVPEMKMLGDLSHVMLA